MKTPRFKHKYFLIASVTATLLYGVLSLRDYVGAYGRGLVTFVHGWPMAYLTRIQLESTFGARWKLFSGIEEFQFLPLLFDIAFNLCLGLFIAIIWQLHCRSQKFWQFSLKKLLLVTSVLGMTAGAYAYLRRQYVEEDVLLIQMERDGWSLRIADGYLPWYLQPLRDLRIVDEKDWC
jgi:hypothetical protein